MEYKTIDGNVTKLEGGEGALLAGRFRVVRQLGQGGMGSVWLAEDVQLDNKQFAIKMLPSILVSNKRAYQQLKAEALVAMKLTHPNIVTLRAFEENDGNPFLVMDYVDGVTLDDYLAEHGGGDLTQSRREAELQRGLGNGCGCGISEAEVVRILKPIAAALDYAHGKGVVHRDVKPGNVMVAKDGTPYILDFGIAREIQETMTRVTGKLSSGTLLYMSPEQLNGDAPTKEQDIYSFAAMAYECIKGEPPFARGNIEFQIMNKAPEPLAGSGISAAPLAVGIMAGLAKKPDDRPATCAAVLEGDLSDRVEREERVDGGVDDSGHKERKERKGGVGKVLVAAALLAALACGAWWWTNTRNGTEGTNGTNATATIPVPLIPSPVLTKAEREAPRNGECRTLTLPGDVKMEMIYVAPGSFTMGSPESDKERWENETQHRVTLTKGFWIGKYPVTQRQWKALVRANGVSLAEGELVPCFNREGQGRDCVRGMDTSDFPMENISWDDCKVLVDALNRNERGEWHWSFPTEAQWEFAARGGTKSRGYTYSGGNDLDALGWYYENSGLRRLSDGDWKIENQVSNKCRTHSVQEKDVGNELGIVGMSGNVAEWCMDLYDGDYYAKSPTDDPCNTASGMKRILRGGSWFTPARVCRSACRDGNRPNYRGGGYGLRLCYSAQPIEAVSQLASRSSYESRVEAKQEKLVPESPRKLPPAFVVSSSAHKGFQLWEDGPYWAETNIGAEKPWDYGYYFWWGDTVGYKMEDGERTWVASDGSSRNFKFEEKNTPSYGKSINKLRNDGWITEADVLAPEHDAAHVHWGGNWRMPTSQELNDLYEKCDWTWTIVNGVNGYVVRGKGDYSAVSIFLPAAGYGLGVSRVIPGCDGHYGASVPYSDSSNSRYLHFYSSGHCVDSNYRYFGRSVRPVQGSTK